jgi:glutathione S-transferase
MIVVHHLNNSRSQRILWMLEELGLDYEIKLYQREPSMQAPASLRAVHPLGKSPVITDGDKTLAESGAILEYLVETYGGGRFSPPPGTPERLRYTYFLHYAEGSLMPLLFMKLVFTRLPERVPWAMRPVARMISAGADKALLGPQISNHFAFLESRLLRRRHPDELSHRGRRRPRRSRPAAAATKSLRRSDPVAAGLQACAGKRRPLFDAEIDDDRGASC